MTTGDQRAAARPASIWLFLLVLFIGVGLLRDATDLAVRFGPGGVPRPVAGAIVAFVMGGGSVVWAQRRVGAPWSRALAVAMRAGLFVATWWAATTWWHGR